MTRLFQNLLCLFLLFIVCSVSAQNISGNWKGSGVGNLYDRLDQKFEYELSVLPDQKTVVGTLTIDMSISGMPSILKRGPYRITGVYDAASGDLVLLNENMKESRFEGGKGMVMAGQTTVYRMKYSEKGKWQLLEGVQNVDTLKQMIFSYNIKLEKKKEKNVPPPVADVAPNVPVVSDAPVTSTPAPVYEKRNTVIAQTIELDTGGFTVELYDNGEVDQDSVSVFLNDAVLVSHQPLGLKPLTLRLNPDPAQPLHLLKMYAENLGSIPPNTAVMIIKQGDKRYEVPMSSDMDRTGTVLIKLKK